MRIGLWERQAWNRQGVAAVIISATLMLWIYSSLEERPRLAPKPLGHAPDSFMTNFVRTDMTEEGQLKSRLTGARMEHFADDKSIALTVPQLEVYARRPTPWQVKSERAWVDANQDAILMSGHVQAWRNDDQGQLELKVTTERAIVFPKLEHVEGNQAVTIDLQGVRADAVGFRANFIERRIELLSRVKSRYEAKRDP